MTRDDHHNGHDHDGHDGHDDHDHDAHDHDGHDHDGHDDHDHADHSDVPERIALRAKALQSLLVEKGVLDQSVLDGLVDEMEHQVGPHLGARVVARAWLDDHFREQLLTDGRGAVESIGVSGWRHLARLVALANTPGVHNLVVCTLCSCYPTPLLGPPPVWYKSAPYRSRAVIDPRSVLAEFGTELPADTEVRVWDSTAETRYLVVPERPAGTDGWPEERLATLVTRNSMIGVELAKAPEAAR